MVITAATPSDDPIKLAAALCRDRGRVVIVGDVGLDIPRAPYYDKEIDIRLSRSYGPGRYDRAYEERGLDYPVGYVRWTEQRNMQAFVELLASGRIDVEGLISDRVSADQAPAEYDRLASGERSPLGIVLQYEETALETVRPAPVATPVSRATPRVGLIGAGSFAQRILLPGLVEAGFAFASVASGSGLSARSAAERFPFARTVRPDEVIDDPDADVVAIATRHATHAAVRRARAARRQGGLRREAAVPDLGRAGRPEAGARRVGPRPLRRVQPAPRAPDRRADGPRRRPRPSRCRC